MARTVSFVVKDSGDTGNVNSNTATTQINVSAPVTITAVYVSGSSWTSAFKTYLSSHSLGSSTMGYALKTGAAQLTDLPWPTSKSATAAAAPVEEKTEFTVMLLEAGANKIGPSRKCARSPASASRKPRTWSRAPRRPSRKAFEAGG